MSFVLLLSIICGPLHLPLEPAILVGLALIAIIGPLVTAVQTMFSCGMTTILVERKSGVKATPAAGKN